ncbi:hypothetical protein L1049_024687 [Liquidambar formosana]|uniref:Uncharacterized protein n=1 Tax=Liquidambar formosana TaxID=63359 RepID=A0AAP0RW47_LIQFO
MAGNCGNDSEAKKAELTKMKEELERAIDSAMQSWLDSRPFIDQLEKLQTGLDKTRSSTSDTVISESQLEKKEEELKARTKINEMELDEEHRARPKLKRVMRLGGQKPWGIAIKTRSFWCFCGGSALRQELFRDEQYERESESGRFLLSDKGKSS